MYCMGCGAVLPDTANYCPTCGRPKAGSSGGAPRALAPPGAGYLAASGEHILPANTGVPLRRPEPATPAPQMSLLADFLVFRTMITPVIIWLLFWIGVGLCILAGIGIILASLFTGQSDRLLTGLAVLVLGPLVVRIYCELLILFFRMNETLTEIKHALERKGREE